VQICGLYSCKYDVYIQECAQVYYVERKCGERENEKNVNALKKYIKTS